MISFKPCSTVEEVLAQIGAEKSPQGDHSFDVFRGRIARVIERGYTHFHLSYQLCESTNEDLNTKEFMELPGAEEVDSWWGIQTPGQHPFYVLRATMEPLQTLIAA